VYFSILVFRSNIKRKKEMEGELTLFFFFVVTSQGTGLVLEGRHNADMGWISELRRNGNALVNTKCLFFIFLSLIL
jgi:hypothetical protein